MDKSLYKLGRISDIINALKETFKTSSLTSISTAQKLEILCDALGLSIEQFDSLIADNSPVLRTIKGHAFEVAFERILKTNNVPVMEVGGDTETDLMVNGYSLQLKTPNLGGTTDISVEYKTHKTHGANAEIESMDYYHNVEDFADFFVGLISYKPFRVFIIPKKMLPKHHRDERYIQSPFRLSVHEYTSYINDFKALGITSLNLNVEQENNNSLLPKSTTRTGVNADILTDTILRECNFRIWDMSIRGFAREIAIKHMLKKLGVLFSDRPQDFRSERADKADLVIFSHRTNQKVFVQVKGISTNNCRFNIPLTVIATETQLTRGRVNDHPTQSRLYLETDFDYLLLAIDPPIAHLLGSQDTWTLYLIPVSCLNRHHKFRNRLASMQKFTLNDLDKFKVTPNLIQKVFDF